MSGVIFIDDVLRERSFERMRAIVDRNIKSCPRVALLALEFYEDRWSQDSRTYSIRSEIQSSIKNLDYLPDWLGITTDIPAHLESSLMGIRAQAVALGVVSTDNPQLCQYGAPCY